MPDYICTYTSAADALASGMHANIRECTLKSDKYGINYFAVLSTLYEDQQQRNFLLSAAWEELPQVDRVCLAQLVLIVYTCSNKDNLSSVLSHVFLSVKHSFAWYLPNADHNSIESRAALFAQFAYSPDLLVKCMSNRSAVSGYEDLITSLDKLFSISPLLKIWSIKDPRGVAFFLYSKGSVFDVSQLVHACQLKQHSRGQVPFWTASIYHNDDRHKLKQVFKIFPYTSATDKRHMSTNVFAYVTSLLGNNWRETYRQAYLDHPIPTKAAVVKRVNTLLALLPLGTL
ncbi:hypothetical protein TKK_0003888 [Trichogramma kaykai]